LSEDHPIIQFFRDCHRDALSKTLLGQMIWDQAESCIWMMKIKFELKITHSSKTIPDLLLSQQKLEQITTIHKLDWHHQLAAAMMENATVDEEKVFFH
jgi:hypothetical protein